MGDRSRASDALAPYKAQAKRLSEFLSAAGHSLKHTHALEAIARVHGYANFHLLTDAAQRAAPTASDGPWVIAVYGGGLLPLMHVAPSLRDGVATFLHQLSRVLAASNADVVIRGQDRAVHRGLYALHNGALLCSMTAPSFVSAVDLDERPLSLDPLTTMASLAAEITNTFEDRADWTAFETKVHDERYRELLDARLEDVALRGAPDGESNQTDTPIAHQERLIDLAHGVTLVDARRVGGRHE